jgi:hypothetical protein
LFDEHRKGFRNVLVSFAMKQLAFWLVMTCASMVLGAQVPSTTTRNAVPAQSPDVDVSGARAEFISNNDRPRFAVIGIVIRGDVDTLSVIVHPSAIQSIDGKLRYKPKVVRTRRVDSLLEVVLELSGKGLPLPEDSVRGSARLSVRGAGNFRGSRVRFESKRFDVFVANAPLPSIMLSTNDMVVDPILDNTDGIFWMRGVVLRQGSRETIADVEDIRQVHVDSIHATVVSSDVGEVGNAHRYKVVPYGEPKLVSESRTYSVYDFAFKLIDGKYPLRPTRIDGSANITITVVASHGGVTKRRTKVQTVPIRN